MIEPIRRSLSALCIAVTLTTVVESAIGQTEEDRSAARSLATQGLAAHTEGRFAEALDLFSRAETLVHAPPHLLYMARAAVKLGQLVRARELYLKLTREELAANAPPAFRDAQTEAREEVKAIEPRLASLVINVKAPEGVSYKVEMDKRPISSAVIGVAFPVDPGKHQLIATAPGYQSKLVEVMLKDGERERAELELVPTGTIPTTTPATAATSLGSGAPSQAAPSGATSTTPVGSDAGPPKWMRPASYVAMGVGVVGLGLGTYFGVSSRSTRKDGDDAYNRCLAPCLKSDPLARESESKYDDARTAMTLSVVSFVVGGVGIASGVPLFILSSRKASQSAHTVTPYMGWGTAGLRGNW
jgi:hypothetical protein